MLNLPKLPTDSLRTDSRGSALQSWVTSLHLVSGKREVSPSIIIDASTDGYENTASRY
ncbi:hypothetical protein P154DRAFT_517519 [Amniculicola lignicola CBS 123094]|uniref:Uncharacterized protein n=1 Tax=Amniculicola lignicola CBS 123094 TaxID=1392246 RepID=A0A6A5WZ38_9PLEO|nr:hypothetical protein P154DRAFT_517519 [Amniculicola lignicola CBS 123094]